MANQLDLRDLRYFEVIAETGHVGRAAKKLHRTQPALTGCVRRLEQAVGTPLFERVGRNIRLTAAGHALAARARSLRMAADDAVREIGDLGAGVAGHVRIGILPTLARFLLPEATRLFLDEAPGVTIKAAVAQNDVLGLQLAAGELDFIVTTNVRGDDSIVSHPVCEDDAVVIASAKHPVLRRKKVKLDDLKEYRWVLAPEVVGTRQWLERAFARRGLPPPRVQIETNLILMMPALIERTELLTYTSRRHVAPFDPRSSLREVPVKEATMRRRFDLAYRHDSYLSPAALRFAELLRSRGEAIFAGRRSA